MRNTLLLASVCSLVACGGQSDHYFEDVAATGAPVALQDQLVFVRSIDHSALYVGPQAFEEGRVERVELPVGPTAPVTRQGKGDPEALVLCEGRRGDRNHEPVPATLAVLDAAGGQRRYPLGNPFQRIYQSDDGRYAILLKDAQSGRLLDNPLEIAIVDLSEDGEQGVTLRTLQFSDAPVSVHFSPVTRIGEEDRRLAVLFSQREVTFIDLGHLDRVESTVPLSRPSAGEVLPEQVVFDAERATVYVRGAASDDVFVFQLEPRLSDEGHNDFTPSSNRLPAGQGPRDMVLYEAEDGPRLLAVAEASQQAVVVEAGSSRTTTIELEAPADHVLLFEGESPTDSQSAERALLYDVDGRAVAFLDLEKVEEQRSRNLDTLTLDYPISRVIPLLDEGKVVVLHAESAVTLLDLSGRTVTPIRAAQSLTDALFDAKRKRMWVAPESQPWVGYLDLTTGQTAELLLDLPVSTFVAMPDADRFAVVHPGALGELTLFDAAEPSRDTAESLQGFLVDGFLEVGR